MNIPAWDIDITPLYFLSYLANSGHALISTMEGMVKGNMHGPVSVIFVPNDFA